MSTYSQSELKKLFLQDMKELIEEGCEDESRWNELLDSCEFRDMAEQTDFREKAQDIFYGKRFSENIANHIAEAFGSGSHAVRIKREKRWSVEITGFYLTEEMREKFFGKDDPHKLRAVRRGHTPSTELSYLFGRLLLLRRAIIWGLVLLVLAGVVIHGFIGMISDAVKLF